MTSSSNPFRTWLNERGINAIKAADLFGVEPQTIRHWRAQGVPERRRLHVESVMANYQVVPLAPKLETKITLMPTWAQVATWLSAAELAHKTPEDWAIDGLDEIARAELSVRVAEKPEDYKPRKG